MEFTLTISQKQIHENFPTLDIKDAGIIDFLSRFSHDCTKKIVGQKVYYWFDYGKISMECPLLRLESEAIRKRIRAMVLLGIFEPHPNNKGGQIFFAFGENYHLTHRDKSQDGREENPKVKKVGSGRKSQGGREENPKVVPKGREENPDNHKDHSNHNNQSSSEPRIDAAEGLKIELHSDDLNGLRLLDFIPSEQKKENPTPVPPAPSPQPAPGESAPRRWDMFDIDKEAVLLKEDYRCLELYAREIKCDIEVAKDRFPASVDLFIEKQKAKTYNYNNTRDLRDHYFNWLPKYWNATAQPAQIFNQSQKANLNRLGSDAAAYREKPLF